MWRKFIIAFSTGVGLSVLFIVLGIITFYGKGSMMSWISSRLIENEAYDDSPQIYIETPIYIVVESQKNGNFSSSNIVRAVNKVVKKNFPSARLWDITIRCIVENNTVSFEIFDLRYYDAVQNSERSNFNIPQNYREIIISYNCRELCINNFFYEFVSELPGGDSLKEFSNWKVDNIRALQIVEKHYAGEISGIEITAAIFANGNRFGKWLITITNASEIVYYSIDPMSGEILDCKIDRREKAIPDLKKRLRIIERINNSKIRESGSR